MVRVKGAVVNIIFLLLLDGLSNVTLPAKVTIDIDHATSNREDLLRFLFHLLAHDILAPVEVVLSMSNVTIGRVLVTLHWGSATSSSKRLNKPEQAKA